MSSAAKITLALALLVPFTQSLFAKDLSILVIGQSISSNCNAYSFDREPGVYQYDLEGNITEAKDPFLWADCNGGSMWMPLGKKMVSAKMADRVIFMPIGVGGTKITDWLEGGRAHPKLLHAMSVIQSRKIKFDFILWHQGSSDIGTTPMKYKSDFRKLYKIVREKISNATPWIIAIHSRCGEGYDKKIEIAQQELANGLPIFYSGPNNNSLDNDYRFDRCHLNKDGQIRMAQLWFNSIQSANAKKAEFDNESLLRIFRKIPF
jgi:hypothetical protein